MVSLIVVFWIFVIIAAIIGAARGWAKELLVAFSAILAMFILTVSTTFIGIIRDLIGEGDTTQAFWIRTVLMLIFAFFGYQTPNAFERLAAGSRREKARDTVLGLIFGGINAYLVIGSIWFYMSEAGYPFEFILAPNAKEEVGKAAIDLLAKMPPLWLGTPPVIYFAVAIAFAFVVIVFL